MSERDPRGTEPAADQDRQPGAEPSEPKVGAPRASDVLGRRRARAPEHRPTWLIVLSALTLLYGGRLLVGGLNEVRDPRTAIPIPVRASLTPAQDAIVRRFDDVRGRVSADHVRAIRGQAVVSIAEGLVLLLAAAATLSRDKRGRAVALAAAWSGIAFQLGALWLRYPVFQDLANVGGPIWSELVSIDASPAQAKEMTPQFLSSVIRTIPIVMAAFGIISSLVLLRMFGGRRGRVLYGLERARGVRPS